jgi:hypothetical protein
MHIKNINLVLILLWHITSAIIVVCVLSCSMASISLVQSREVTNEPEVADILRNTLSQSDRQWLANSSTSIHRYTIVSEASGKGVREVLIHMCESTMHGFGVISVRRVVFAGWPWLAFRSEDAWPMSGLPPVTPRILAILRREQYFIESPPYMWTWSNAAFRPAPPYHPIISGFVANTAVFIAISGLLHWCVLSVRAHIRRSRMQCERCKYDLRGAISNTCPECGNTRM